MDKKSKNKTPKSRSSSSRRDQQQQQPSSGSRGRVLKESGFGTKRRVTVKSAEMSPLMQRLAVRLADAALDKFAVDDDEALARHMKAEFDRRFAQPWHCVVGRPGRFSAFVTCQQGYMIYFEIGQRALLLFKAKD